MIHFVWDTLMAGKGPHDPGDVQFCETWLWWLYILPYGFKYEKLVRKQREK